MTTSFLHIKSPLDQFEIRDLISLDFPIFGNLHLSITNIGLYLSIAFFISLSLNIINNNDNKLVSNN